MSGGVLSVISRLGEALDAAEQEIARLNQQIEHMQDVLAQQAKEPPTPTGVT